MKPVHRIVLAVVVANAALGGWFLLREPAVDTAAPPAPVAGAGTVSLARYDLRARAKDLNVIVIDVDSLRFDRLAAGGNPDALTPNLDAFAKEAVVFRKAISAAPWTVPATMSIWTGRWPSSHGVTNKLKLDAKGEMALTTLAPEIRTFPEMLVGAGWTAAAFTGGAGVSASFGYGRGFTTYLDDRRFAGLDYSAPPAMAWLEQNLDSHFFLFLHGYDVHGQHPLDGIDPRVAVPAYKGTLDGSIEEQARLREQGLAAIQRPGDPATLEGVLSAEDAAFLLGVYDAKVRQADERVGKVLDRLRTSGLLDRSIVAIVADHGEEFMEHAYIDHGATLCDHQLHVPLMIRFPGDTQQVLVDTPVRTLDLFPTLFDALGVAGPDGADGKSLLPLLRGEQATYPIFAESDYRLFVHQRMAQLGDDRLVLDLEDGQRQLFDLAADPAERHDASVAKAREAYELEQSLRTWMDATRTNPADYLGVRQDPIKIF